MFKVMVDEGQPQSPMRYVTKLQKNLKAPPQPKQQQQHKQTNKQHRKKWKIKGNLSNKMDLVEIWRISAISNTFIELYSGDKGISDLQLTCTCVFSCCDFSLILLWNSILLIFPWRDHLTPKIKPASPPKNRLCMGTDAFVRLMKQPSAESDLG